MKEKERKGERQKEREKGGREREGGRETVKENIAVGR